MQRVSGKYERHKAAARFPAPPRDQPTARAAEEYQGCMQEVAEQEAHGSRLTVGFGSGARGTNSGKRAGAYIFWPLLQILELLLQIFVDQSDLDFIFSTLFEIPRYTSLDTVDQSDLARILFSWINNVYNSALRSSQA